VVAEALAGFLGEAQTSLDVALYDLRLPPPLADTVVGALVAASRRGIAIRLAYNLDHAKVLPPPPQAEPEQVEALPVPTRGIPGVPDLMHHKYVVRDRETVWTGSTNWTEDSWTREENAIVTVRSTGLANAFTADFEQLWETREVSKTGRVGSDPIRIGDATVSPWFCPGHGERLAHRIAHAIGSARRRIRIASPVITSGPILGTLAQVASDGRVDLAGVVDATQVAEVVHQWRANGNSPWKEPTLRAVLSRAPFTGKHSTPYAPGAVHDYMHAKVTVADDTSFVGSFNLSHSGELNAENVLEIEDGGLAEQLAAYVDTVRARYAPVELPEPAPAAPPAPRV
jgi:phosphatidylserine/phosphatidylglycerophosphate/cardiolipin synthase-like enzyme